MDVINQAPVTAPEKSKQNIWMWIIIAVASVGLIIISAYAYFYAVPEIPEIVIPFLNKKAADSVESLEKDLEGTAVDGLDVELGDIEKEIVP